MSTYLYIEICQSTFKKLNLPESFQRDQYCHAFYVEYSFGVITEASGINLNKYDFCSERLFEGELPALTNSHPTKRLYIVRLIKLQSWEE